MALAQGRPAILVGTVMEPGHQVDIWSRGLSCVGRTVPSRCTGGPIKLEVTYDQSRYAETRLLEVAKNLGIGVTLVVLVLYW